MLSKTIVDFCTSNGWWFDDASADYAAELRKLDIDPDSECATFYLHADDGPTFNQGGDEIYQLCWFSKYTNYDLALKRTHDTLQLPVTYLPLCSFEGGNGYFYDRADGSVVRVSLGGAGSTPGALEIAPKWPTFSAFLEAYFGLS